MKIILFGGSGIISSEICRLAIERKCDVTIFNRGRRKEEMHSEALLIVGDLLKESVEQIRGKIAPYYDVVIDFIGRNPSQQEKTLAI